MFCNLILEATFHHFCPILFIRNKSGSLTRKGKELHKGMNTRRQTSSGDILEAAMSHPVYLIPKFLYFMPHQAYSLGKTPWVQMVPGASS